MVPIPFDPRGAVGKVDNPTSTSAGGTPGHAEACASGAAAGAVTFDEALVTVGEVFERAEVPARRSAEQAASARAARSRQRSRDSRTRSIVFSALVRPVRRAACRWRSRRRLARSASTPRRRRDGAPLPGGPCGP